MSSDPWIPSHVNLGRHPKVRRAARLAGCSVPAMVGHLHLLWHWTLTISPDGDLSRFEGDDLADAAMWTGDPDSFVKALIDCGPGDSEGFLEASFRLHDWASYGGRYTKRSAAGKAAAAARWADKGTPPDQGRDAIALQAQCVGNAEERRGEERTTTRGPSKVGSGRGGSSADADGFDAFWKLWRRKVARQDAARAFQKAMRSKDAPTIDALLAAVRAQLGVWDREQRPLDKHPHAATWLNGRRWEDDALAVGEPQDDDPYAGVTFR